MSFGKRSGKSDCKTGGGREPASASKAAFRIGTVTSQRTNIAIVVGQVASVAVIVSVAAMMYFGTSINAVTKPFAKSGAQIENQPLLPGERTTRSPALETVLHACLPGLPPKSKETASSGSSFWKRVALVNHAAGIVKSEGSEHMSARTLAFGTYLKCAMVTHRDRFCDSENRADIASEIKYYFGSLATDTAAAAGTNPAAADSNDFMARIARLEKARGAKTSKKRKSRKSTVTIAPDPGVLEKMRDLIAAGYLSKEDFGWYLPSDIGTHFKKVVFALDACS